MSDIAILFARDPLEMTEEDIDRIIESMREKRHLFNTGAAPTKGKLTKKEEEITEGLKLDLDLNLGGK
jgi:hypothetical protein